MPVILYCFILKAAWLFEWVDSEGIYDTDANMKAANMWLLAWHACEGEHVIIPAADPYEMNGI